MFVSLAPVYVSLSVFLRLDRHNYHFTIDNPFPPSQQITVTLLLLRTFVYLNYESSYTNTHNCIYFSTYSSPSLYAPTSTSQPYGADKGVFQCPDHRAHRIFCPPSRKGQFPGGGYMAHPTHHGSVSLRTLYLEPPLIPLFPGLLVDGRGLKDDSPTHTGSRMAGDRIPSFLENL